MGIKVSNNVFPHDPDDNWKEKLDRGGYTGTAQDLKNQIDQYVFPDDIVVKGTISKVDNFVSIAALAFTCRIDQIEFSNTEAYSTTILPAADGFRRIDILVFTKYSSIVKIQGIPGIESAQEPDTPDETIKIAFFNVFGSIISDPEVPPSLTFETRIALLENNKVDKEPGKSLVDDEEIEKLALLDPTSDIDKPVSTAQAAADAAVLEAANDYTDAGLALKLDAADYNDRFKGVYLTEVALNAAHPTANAGDSAQVNETGSTKVINYSWDAEESVWVNNGSGGSGATNTDTLPEGTSNLYFTTARVLATALTGLSFLTGGAIVPTDSILVAFGKIQKQINDGLTGSNIRSLLGITTLTGSNTGDETATSIATINHAATEKTTLVDGDEISGLNSTSGFSLIRFTCLNLYNYLKLKFDSLYASKSPAIVETGTSFSLDNTYNGKILVLTASCTVTLPNGLASGFGITIVNLAGVTLTLAVGGSVTLFNNVGLTMAEKLSCTIQNRIAINQYITAGNI